MHCKVDNQDDVVRLDTAGEIFTMLIAAKDTPEAALLTAGAEEMVMSGVSCSVNQNSTALKTPSAVNARSRLLRPLSSGGQRMLKCQASTGSVRGRYMPSASGAPAAVCHVA